jgi:hypothetical protein
MMLLVLPLSTGAGDAARARRRRARRSRRRQALVEAFGHRSYVLLVLGFFTCGFQLAFVTVHLPSYLVDAGWRRHRRLDHRADRLFNIVGSLGSGWLVGRMPKRYLLRSSISAARFASSADPAAADRRADADLRRVTGLLWLSTVPPTSGWWR